MIDLFVIVVYLWNELIYELVGWELMIFLDEDSFLMEIYVILIKVLCFVNVVWKWSRFLVLVGGGVLICVSDVLSLINLFFDDCDWF